MSLHCDEIVIVPTTYTLTRGTVASELVPVKDLKKLYAVDEADLSTKKKEELEKERKKTVEKLCARAKGLCGDPFRTITFQTSQSIALKSLGFWGPLKEEMGEYQVTIVISKLSCITPGSKQSSEIIAQFNDVVQGSRKSIFYVHLDPPVHIQQHVWVKLEFKLNGPPTCRCDDVQYHYKDGDVSFDFSTSSHQLPVIKYEIV